MYIVMEIPDPDDCIGIQVEVTGCFEFKEASGVALDLSEERGKEYGVFILQYIAEPPGDGD